METDLTSSFNRSFLPIIWSFIQAFAVADEPEVKKKLKESLKYTLRLWSDQPVKMVSRDVFDRIKAFDDNIDPFKLMWGDRNILGSVSYTDKTSKSGLVWEHTTPLNDFFNTLINCRTINEAKDALEKYSGVCWISREEDMRLNAKGYRSKRPGGWRKCYEECGIEVMQKFDLQFGHSKNHKQEEK